MGDYQALAGQPWWQAPQWIVVLITAIYALFSGLQWWAIRRQSQDLVRLERPWIFVGHVNLMAPLASGNPIVVGFAMTNNGRGTGVITEENTELRVIESLPRWPRYSAAATITGQGILNPGMLSPDHQNTFRPITQAEYDDIVNVNGRRQLYWLGYVRYEDALRKRHIYRFCMRYFPHGFAPDGPKAYNRIT